MRACKLWFAAVILWVFTDVKCRGRGLFSDVKCHGLFTDFKCRATTHEVIPRHLTSSVVVCLLT